MSFPIDIAQKILWQDIRFLIRETVEKRWQTFDGSHRLLRTGNLPWDA
jgi:hypothetical protein